MLAGFPMLKSTVRNPHVSGQVIATSETCCLILPMMKLPGFLVAATTRSAQTLIFHLVKNIVYSPLLVLERTYHYW